MGVHFKLTPSHRAAIEDQIEALIALLDGFDGDPDLEPEHDRCGAADDGCGRLEAHQARFAFREVLAVPFYGIDQDTEPTNQREAEAEKTAAALGLVRTERGTWRRSS